MHRSKTGHVISWKWLLSATTIILTLLVMFIGKLPVNQRSASTLPAYTRSAASGAQALSTGTVVGSPTPIHTPDPNYSNETLHATAVAIVHALATVDPLPTAGTEWARSRALASLWDAAYATAVVLYPAPPNWDPPMPTEVIPLTPIPIPTEPIRRAGAGSIYDDSFSLHLTNKIKIANRWGETVGNQQIIVYAGRKFQNQDAQQGMVMVVTYANGTWDITSGPDLYETPSRAGMVQVIDGVGERLTLRAEDGTLFYFDLPTRAWVSP